MKPQAIEIEDQEFGDELRKPTVTEQSTSPSEYAKGPQNRGFLSFWRRYCADAAARQWISRVPAEFQNAGQSTAWWPGRPSRRRLTKWFPAVACQLSSGGIDAYTRWMMQLSEETKMPEIVTVSERKARETARRRAAALAVMAEAREFASVHGGRFHVFGSAAEDRMKYDSDFDVVVDFPLPTEMEAAEFVEEACRRRNIPSDIHLRSRASARFLDRIRDSMMSLP
jgi:predicted nucleotidyltransferase